MEVLASKIGQSEAYKRIVSFNVWYGLNVIADRTEQESSKIHSWTFLQLFACEDIWQYFCVEELLCSFKRTLIKRPNLVNLWRKTNPWPLFSVEWCSLWQEVASDLTKLFRELINDNFTQCESGMIVLINKKFYIPAGLVFSLFSFIDNWFCGETVTSQKCEHARVSFCELQIVVCCFQHWYEI